MEKPGLPKGTRDFSPTVMSKRQHILDTIRNIFSLHGFQPLETPAMENLSTLTGKYGEEGDQLLFRILNSGDFLKDVDQSKLSSKQSRIVSNEIAEKGLRYDLTVPFARFVVMNKHEITFPFKRYQIQPVWRADRPQKGRYREFYQCDADVVGTHSLVCEAEIILMIREVFSRLGIKDYSIKINHRDVLNGIAEKVGAKGNETAMFVAIDKLDKIGKEKVAEELSTKGFSNDNIDNLFDLLEISGSTTEKLSKLGKEFTRSSSGGKGVSDLAAVLELLKKYGADDDHVEFDIALARGLSYYTGCIFEVKIHGVAVGSVSGGGRYDDLTGAFGDKENLSGVGFSFGVDRLYDAMEELGLFPTTINAASKALICHFDQPSFDFGLRILSQLRNAGIPSEIFPDQSKIKKQLEYADRKQIPWALVIGSDEVSSGLISAKNLTTGDQEKLSVEQIIVKLK